ncbi:DUF4365 domain-containing protein [Mumia xiangluensis]|uniref:Uncharacterized protein DUF4365 n=2 Tax=Propionibacteriales TaxID=85009 RepID=A0A542EWN0_9ACTN|nr:uncharacterized protein DUF4365 [Kribbella jejuensis]
MESFQEGYLRAVCASAGCVIARPEIDEGIDVSVTHRADSHLATDRVARLEIQLKATTASDFGSDFVKVRLGQERYNYYAVSNPSVHKIVVGLAMPADQDQWIVSSHNALSVHYCAYWINLAGAGETDAEKKDVKISKAQIFDDVALCDIMERIGQGGAP